MNSRDKNDAQPGFADMFASLPDVEPTLPASPADSVDDKPRVIAAGEISDMFSALPDVDPRTQSHTSRMRDAAPAVNEADFEMRQEIHPPAGTNSNPQAPHSVSGPSRTLRAVRPVAAPFTSHRMANHPSEQPAAARRPVAPATLKPALAPAPAAAPNAAEGDGQSTSQQIMEHLEAHKLLATCQLRIEVHNGVVVAAGEVPSAYEKQLVSHFCRQVPGVAKYVDSLTVRGQKFVVSTPSETPGRRRARQGIEWNLPFRAWQAGAAVGLVVVIWGAISLGWGHGLPERATVYPLTGNLVFDGQPAAGASIMLYPQDPEILARPRASVDDDGTFQVTTYEPGDGAPAGEYKVTIEWRRPAPGQEGGGDEAPVPNVLPSAYALPQTTPVKITVEEGENEFPPIAWQN